ncbi:Lrp/AsnC family transcriptional regulator [Methylibium sp. Pch-M]|uniref:Lrp/AsnC family transcriptional regulator n=1 Tax=Methylibium TaxID=316612 RepID=UPI0003F47739|nr:MULTISPECIES: Lrp/AsnC family transcriptional regulator [Methylibium]EWS56620.1 Leucine-responsive regulatory protein [Methylibium sp. T29]EWS61688.1 Leucine-responsive regulatory protein [Methylibium sp. T29-B]MBN9204295.1 Lrp/AsnC family transcriptional regulator [Methylibium petroleiphilum]QAZ40067.1 Lrp/AsnC family transcriptional regulator [Methylibium sp. Pch-M]
MNKITLDPLDLRLLAQLQRDASLSNQALAAEVHVATATTHRRVRRFHALGLIERVTAQLSPQRLADAGLPQLHALLEVTLDVQTSEGLDAFEARAVADASVQQCWRVSPGPDFMLVVGVRDMEAYQAFTARLLTADANVRNVRAFFSIKRAKFGSELPLPAR